jgi:hypothetical protein
LFAEKDEWKQGGKTDWQALDATYPKRLRTAQKDENLVKTINGNDKLTANRQVLHLECEKCAGSNGNFLTKSHYFYFIYLNFYNKLRVKHLGSDQSSTYQKGTRMVVFFVAQNDSVDGIGPLTSVRRFLTSFLRVRLRSCLCCAERN